MEDSLLSRFCWRVSALAPVPSAFVFGFASGLLRRPGSAGDEFRSGGRLRSGLFLGLRFVGETGAGRWFSGPFVRWAVRRGFCI